MGNVQGTEAVGQQAAQQATPWLWDTMAPLIERVSLTAAVFGASYFAARAATEPKTQISEQWSWTTACKAIAITTCAVACLSTSWKTQRVALIGFAITTFALVLNKHYN
jgi:hypothetical protein